MEIISAPIKKAVEIAVAEGNSVQEISEGWSAAKQVVSMSGRLTPSVRARIEHDVPGLSYWTDAGSPHYAASEGFMSDADGVGLSFPAA